MAEIIINSPKYGQKVFLIDDEDVERTSTLHWTVKKDKGNFYAHAVIDGRRFLFKHITLHRFIMNAKKGEIIDHINRNTQDNRKSNLRVVTNQHNALNSRMFRTNTSGYKGVYKRGNKWQAMIRVNDKLLHIGMYSTKEEANEARIKAEQELTGFYRT